MRTFDITVHADAAPFLDARVYKGDHQFAVLRVTDMTQKFMAPFSIQIEYKYADRLVEAVAAFNAIMQREELAVAAEKAKQEHDKPMSRRSGWWSERKRSKKSKENWWHRWRRLLEGRNRRPPTWHRYRGSSPTRA